MSNEWQLVDSRTLQRNLRGLEVLINKSEQHQHGNFQLIMGIYFETKIPCKDLEKHLEDAWFRVRQIYPVIAVKIFSPNDGLLNVATFQALQDEKEARAWSKQTTFIVNDGQTVDEIVTRYLKQPMNSTGSQATITLVTSPKNDSAGFVIRMSHVLSAHETVHIIKEVAKQLVVHRHLPIASFKENVELICPRLPASVIHAYQEKFKPTEEDVNHGFQLGLETMGNFAKNTIGIPIKTDWKSRKSNLHNLRFTFTLEESSAIVQTLARNNVTLTSAFYACLCAAIAQLSSLHDKVNKEEEEEKEGVHLIFSAHAKRWLSTAGEEGGPTIPMGVIPGNTWLQASSKELRANNVEQLIHLARKISKSTTECLSNPHVLSAIDEFAKSIGDNPSLDEMEEPLALSRPNLSSQGTIFEPCVFTSNATSKEWLKLTDMIFCSRNTDPTVCFAAQFISKQFRYSVLFDEKYFDLDETNFLAKRAGNLLRLFAAPACKL